MKINVAGAGAGKTSKMAQRIMEKTIPKGKVVFCIAFTNSAADNIEKKIIKEKGEIPDNIRISTIHSFLYNELIKPYYYCLYGKYFDRISAVNLSNNVRYRSAEMSRLEKENILHVKKIPEKAKWVVCNKSSDGKKKRILRKEVLKRFSEYCAGIFVDEAQDIGTEVKSVFEALDMAGVEIVLYGDPKQDIKGFGCFRDLITNASDVKYISECYRCPQKHLDISNLFSPICEKQKADENNAEGSMGICFENDIEDMGEFLNDNNWGLKYISRKQGRFTTHGQNENYCQIESLNYMVYKVVTKRDDEVESELYVRRNAFYIAEKMLEMRKKGVEAGKIITNCVNKGMIKRLNKTEYGKMMSALNYKNDKQTSVMIVKSIESVKGLEDKNCLFIVTKDLAPYLFWKKTDDNKEKHLLYVGLTRSLANLILLITKEVEVLYGREEIKRYFEKYNVYEEVRLLNMFD